VYFYKVGEKLGVERLAWYASASGLGQPTGLGLSCEADGLVPTAAWKQRRTGRPWVGGETLSLAIGQGYNLVTPLQLAMLTAAVANGGTVYRPLLAESVEQADHGRVLRRFDPEVLKTLPVSEANLAVIRRGLCKVVNGSRGTATIAALPGVKVCGKTGTAQVVGRRSGAGAAGKEAEKREHLPHAWFVAYAPAKDPKIAVVVLVEHGEHGSSTASPIARDLIVHFLGIDREPAGEEG